MKVSVVILCESDDACLWLSLSSAVRALKNIRASVVVADNTLQGIDTSRLVRRFPEVLVVRSSGYEFPEIFHRNVEACPSEYVLWMHAGVVIPDNFIEVAVESMGEHPDFGSCSGLLLTPGTKHEFMPMLSRMLHPKTTEQETSPVVCKACWLFRKEMIQKVGTLAGDLPEMGRDADFMHRINASGYQNILLPLRVLQYNMHPHALHTCSEIRAYHAGMKRYFERMEQWQGTRQRFSLFVHLKLSMWSEMLKLQWGKRRKKKSAGQNEPNMLIFTNEAHVHTLRNLFRLNRMDDTHRFVLSSEKSVSSLALWKTDHQRPFTHIVFDNSQFSYAKILSLLEECQYIQYNIGIYDSDSRTLVLSGRIYHYNQPSSK